MSIVVPMEGFGGGGTLLNFKVVGNPQPENPKENTIWVDTDEKITSWYFSTEKPNPASVEIYTEEGVTTGKYLSSSGTETSGSIADWISTAKIPLPDGTISVQMTAGETGGTKPYHWFYDEAGNPISGVLRQSGTVIYDVPTGAKSIRVSLLPTEDEKSIVANYYAFEEGMVWFSTGISSFSEFNALKKNGIMVYPISAEQCVNGALIGKTMKIYKNGMWKSMEYIIAPNTEAVWTSSGVSVSKTEESTALTHTAKSSVSGELGYTYAQTKFDATGYTTLHLNGTYKVNNTSQSDQRMYLQIKDVSGNVVSTIYSIQTKAGINGGTQSLEKMVDISALSGVHYLYCKVNTWTTVSIKHYVTITDCRVY